MSKDEKFKVAVASNGIDFKTVKLDDPVPTGRQILTAAKLAPVDEHSLFAILPNGDFEEVRLDEEFDARGKGTEQFIAFDSDPIYRLFANSSEVYWGLPTIKEDELRFVGRATHADSVFLEVRGGTDRLIAPGTTVDLSEPGVEHFITVAKAAVFHFLVNGVRYDTDQSSLTGLQIKARVADWDPTHDLALEGQDDADDRIVGDDELITIEVHPIRRFSSVPKANFG